MNAVLHFSYMSHEAPRETSMLLAMHAGCEVQGTNLMLSQAPSLKNRPLRVRIFHEN